MDGGDDQLTIMLLGGTGYLGSNIAKAFSQNGYRLICVVRNKSNTSFLESLENVELVSNETGQLELTIRRNHIDWIINGVCTYKSNDSLYGDMFQANVIFPLSVLNLAIKYGITRFVTVGTALPEDFNLYSFTKHKFSDFGRFLSMKDGISFLELKLEMFYGGINEPINRFMNSCRIKLKNNEIIELTSGIQKRDVVRVEDVVGIMEKLIENNCYTGYSVLPVGSGEQHSIKEIVEYMKEIIGSKSVLEFGAITDRQGEPDTLASINWYSRINYKIKYSFWEGIKDFCSCEGKHHYVQNNANL